jgi:hypothetical protein
MHDVMRKRLMRLLEALPDEQLYQVLDYIEFLEAKYAPRPVAEPSGLQRFAERFEDQMRLRSLAPRVVSGTMKLIGSAGRVVDNLTETGQELIHGLESGLGLGKAPREGEGAEPPADAAREGEKAPPKADVGG